MIRRERVHDGVLQRHRLTRIRGGLERRLARCRAGRLHEGWEAWAEQQQTGRRAARAADPLEERLRLSTAFHKA